METIQDLAPAKLTEAFKSHYVVWKLLKPDNSAGIKYSLNRTM